MKKFAAYALIFAFIISSLAGCGTEAPENSSTPEASSAPEAEAVEYDWDAAWAAHDAGEVVMTVNGEEVYWPEYFYWLYSEYAELAPGMDITEPVPGYETMTVGEYVTASAAQFCTDYHVLAQKAAGLGIELTDTDREVLANQLESDIAEYAGEDGTEEELYEYLEGLYVTPEVYGFVNEIMALYPRIFISLYGETGEKVTDEQAMEFAEKYGFMTAKHILFRTTDDEGNALSDEEKAAKLEQANSVLAELRAVPEAEREALFDELMNRYSEDPGLERYPDGYCFEPDTVVAEFAAGTSALEVGDISGVVESASGYHILLRMPVTPDDSVLMNTPEVYTLRYAAAAMLYSEQYAEWSQSAEVEYTPDFNEKTLEDLVSAK